MLSHSPRLKICGLTREVDVESACRLGAWAIGFVFYRKSPRYISPKEAGIINHRLADSKSIKVGVFVNSSIESLEESIQESLITAIQLHGDESFEYCQRVKEKFPHLEVIKALRLKRGDFSNISQYFHCDYILLDSYLPGKETVWGGTGVANDFLFCNEIGNQFPEVKFIFSGGVNSENIQSTVLNSQAYAVDVSSGVEHSPGIKSEAKLKYLFQRAGGSK